MNHQDPRWRYQPLTGILFLTGGLGIIVYSLFLSATLYSYFVIGRDEANFLLRSSMDIFSANSLPEKIDLLFQTHGQHILLGMQLANLLSVATTGFIDFQFINIIGILYLVLPALLICWCFARQASKTYSFVFSAGIACAVIFAIILSPGHLSCAINTACTGNHYLGLGAAIAALYFFIPVTPGQVSIKRILAAEFFAAMGVFSSPAALALIPLFFVVSFFTGQQKRTGLYIHMAFSLVYLTAYFLIADNEDFANNAPHITLEQFLTLLVLYPVFFLNLLGSVFFWPQSTPGVIASCGLGMLVFVSGLVLLKRHFGMLQQRMDLLFYAAGFILLLGMITLITIGRAQSIGSPRYIIYACFVLVFVCLFFLATRPASTWIPVLLASCCLAYYPIQLGLNRDYTDRIRRDIAACNQRWLAEGKACGVMIKHDEATALLLEAERRGILRLPR